MRPRLEKLPPRVDPLTFMRDPQLLNYQPFFGAECFIRVIYGMKLDSTHRDFLAQEHLFGPLADEPEGGWNPSGYQMALLVLGSRASKTTNSANLGIYEAATRNWRDYGYIGPRELAYITIIAQRQDAADELAKQFIITGLQESPRLSEIVVEKFGDFGEDAEITEGGPETRARQKREKKRRIKFGSTMRRVILTNGNAIVARPCNGAATRGYPIPFAILDELMHWNRVTSTQSLDRDVYRGLMPRMAQFGEYKKLLMISTPMGMNGFGWERFDRRHELAKDQFTMHAPTRMMNPTIPVAEYERAKAEDPILYLREWEAHFLDESMSFIDPNAIDACINQENYLPAPDQTRYSIMTIDPAFKSDTFSMVVGHFDAESKRIFVDVVEGLQPRRDSGLTRNRYQPARISDDAKPNQLGNDAKRINATLQPVVPEVAMAKIQLLYSCWHVDELWTDQMSSSLLLPALQREGINAKALHFSNEDRRKMYSLLKVVIESGRLVVAGRGQKWVERLRNELKMLCCNQTPTGATTITKGGGSSDDFTDAVAHLIYRLWRRFKVAFGVGSGAYAAFAAQRGAGVPQGSLELAPEKGGLMVSADNMFNQSSNHRHDSIPSAFDRDLFVPPGFGIGGFN